MTIEHESHRQPESSPPSTILPREINHPRTMLAFVLEEKGFATISPVLTRHVSSDAPSIEKASAIEAWHVTYTSFSISAMVERLQTTPDFMTLEMIHHPLHISEHTVNRRLKGAHTWEAGEREQLKSRFLANKLADMQDYHAEKGYTNRKEFPPEELYEVQTLRNQIKDYQKRLRRTEAEPMSDETLKKLMTKLLDNSWPK